MVVDDSIGQPNGIAFNPDGTIVYISDTAAVSGPVDPDSGHPGTPFNATYRRYAYWPELWLIHRSKFMIGLSMLLM